MAHSHKLGSRRTWLEVQSKNGPISVTTKNPQMSAPSDISFTVRISEVIFTRDAQAVSINLSFGPEILQQIDRRSHIWSRTHYKIWCQKMLQIGDTVSLVCSRYRIVRREQKVDKCLLRCSKRPLNHPLFCPCTQTIGVSFLQWLQDE